MLKLVKQCKTNAHAKKRSFIELYLSSDNSHNYNSSWHPNICIDHSR